jgi:transposase InsO family protein
VRGPNGRKSPPCVLAQLEWDTPRYHRTLDKGTIHAVTADGARATIAARIDHYNNHRLHSAIGYITPRDKLLGHEDAIWTDRNQKLEQARELRRKRRELDHLGAAA